MYFTYRKNKWKVIKSKYSLDLLKHRTTEKGEDAWEIIGYYSCPKTLIKKLIKEHLFDEKEGKNLLNNLNRVESELLMAFKDNLKGVD